jgi:hypothetical protein
MDAKFALASTAALIADPGRAAMLTSLLDGRAMAAGELASQGGKCFPAIGQHAPVSIA